MLLPATFRGQVVRGAGRGATLGFPTANLALDEPLPPDVWGVYASWVRYAGRMYPSVAHVGPAASFGETNARLEVYLIGWSGTLHEKTLAVELVVRIRGTRKFSDPAKLVSAMQQDVATAARRLKTVAQSAAVH